MIKTSGIVTIWHADHKILVSLLVFLDVQCPLFLKGPKSQYAIGQEKLTACKQSKHGMHMEACKTNMSTACTPAFAITATNTCFAGLFKQVYS